MYCVIIAFELLEIECRDDDHRFAIVTLVVPHIPPPFDRKSLMTPEPYFHDLIFRNNDQTGLDPRRIVNLFNLHPFFEREKNPRSQ